MCIYEKSKIDFLRCWTSRKAFEPTSQRRRTTKIFYLPEEHAHGGNRVIVRFFRILGNLWHFLHRSFIDIDTEKVVFQAISFDKPPGRHLNLLIEISNWQKFCICKRIAETVILPWSLLVSSIFPDVWHFLQVFFIYIDVRKVKNRLFEVLDLPEGIWTYPSTFPYDKNFLFARGARSRWK